VVGSSRNSTGGRVTRAAPTSSRRRIPPEYVRTGTVGGLRQPEALEDFGATLLDRRARELGQRPIRRRFSRPVRFGSTAAFWPASPIR